MENEILSANDLDKIIGERLQKEGIVFVKTNTPRIGTNDDILKEIPKIKEFFRDEFLAYPGVTLLRFYKNCCEDIQKSSFLKTQNFITSPDFIMLTVFFSGIIEAFIYLAKNRETHVQVDFALIEKIEALFTKEEKEVIFEKSTELMKNLGTQIEETYIWAKEFYTKEEEQTNALGEFLKVLIDKKSSKEDVKAVAEKTLDAVFHVDNRYSVFWNQKRSALGILNPVENLILNINRIMTYNNILQHTNRIYPL